jgi:hypothetical protein
VEAKIKPMADCSNSCFGSIHGGFGHLYRKLLWIEAALFLRQDQRDDRLRWFVPELLLQIKNARLDR